MAYSLSYWAPQSEGEAMGYMTTAYWLYCSPQVGEDSQRYITLSYCGSLE